MVIGTLVGLQGCRIYVLDFSNADGDYGTQRRKIYYLHVYKQSLPALPINLIIVKNYYNIITVITKLLWWRDQEDRARIDKANSETHTLSYVRVTTLLGWFIRTMSIWFIHIYILALRMM